MQKIFFDRNHQCQHEHQLAWRIEASGRTIVCNFKIVERTTLACLDRMDNKKGNGAMSNSGFCILDHNFPNSRRRY